MGLDVSPNDFERQLLLKRIDRFCQKKCINRQDLAKKAGISRTLFSSLQRGKVRWPQTSTLNKIARALELTPQELCDIEAEERRSSAPARACEAGEGGELDRRTNPVIAEVYQSEPDLFLGWKQAEWDEIYSLFGVGGALTRSGVRTVAVQINQRRETLRQVQILLDTHQRDRLVEVIDQLYRSVQPVSDFYDTEDLRNMIRARQARAL